MQTIVVVEEDNAIRALFCGWLTEAGYPVSDRQTVGVVPDPGAQLLIVDLLNFRTESADIVRRARTLNPQAKLLGLSTQLSHTLAGDSAQAKALGLVSLVGKPCTRDELLAAVKVAIGPAL